MAKHPMLLLLAVWMLEAGLWLEAEAWEPPYGEKICGRDFVRTVIYTCGKLHFSRSATLDQEAMGDAFPDADTKLDKAVASGGWLALRRSRDVPDLFSLCCLQGCKKEDISPYC